MDAEDLRAFDELSAEAGEGLWGCEVEVAGTTVRANAPRPRMEGGLIAGSEELIGELTVRIRKCSLPATPEVDKVLKAHGQWWVIREVRTNEVDACWVLRCEPKN